MIIFVLDLATILITSVCLYLAKNLRWKVVPCFLMTILCGFCIGFMWAALYIQPMQIEEASKYEPTPLDSVQEIILIDLDGNGYSFEIVEVE